MTASGPKLITVMGPTASGKSALAERIADQLDARIINADAFQIYRYLDIGTAKPNQRERYELLDIRNPNDDFGVGEYVLMACEILEREFEAGKSVVLCGGTGFYVRALLEEFKDLSPSPSPELRAELNLVSLDDLVAEALLEPVPDNLDLKNRLRVQRLIEKRRSSKLPIKFALPPFEVTKIGIVPDLEALTERINQRVREMLGSGWIEEVKQVLDRGYTALDPGLRAIGYTDVIDHINELATYEELLARIQLQTVQYAKRQRTWLRSEPKLRVFVENDPTLDEIIGQPARMN